MKHFVIVFVACMISMVVVSCGGNSKSTETDRIAQLEDSIAKLNEKSKENVNNEIRTETPKAEVKVNTETEVKQEDDDTGWKGADSRNDFPNILSGTTWEGDGGTLNSLYKYEFSGNTATQYVLAKRRDNYDDPIVWGDGWSTTFYSVKEEKKGVYTVQYRHDPTGNSGQLFFEFDGKRVYKLDYNGKNKRIPLKQVK